MNKSYFVLQFARVGDVLRLQKNTYVLVIGKCSSMSSSNNFYFTDCLFDGTLTPKKYKISAANYIQNSIMLDSKFENIEIVNHIELKSYTVFHNCKKYTWSLTTDSEINNHMSHLDDRFRLFSDVASSDDLKTYDKNEDRNYHTENADFVSEFCGKFLVSKILKSKGL